MITVFTPTYNRAKLLTRLYRSLQEQTYKNFEWLIVDDGSTDETDLVVNELKNGQQNFPIRYFKTENGGKHRAINYGVSKAMGEAFFIVDSDDWLPSNALSDISYYFEQVQFDHAFAGVAGLKVAHNGTGKEKSFNGEYLDATSLERHQYGIIGEKAEVFQTELLKNYPFPVYDGENFISEAIVWNKIAYDGLKLRWFNRCVYIYEYQEDGLTNNLRKRYQNNPRGYLSYVEQEIRFQKRRGIKKYLLYGKCFQTVKHSKITNRTVRKLLGIHLFQELVAKIIFIPYSLIRGKK